MLRTFKTILNKGKSKMQSGENLTHLEYNQDVNVARKKNAIGFGASYEGGKVDSTPA